MTQCQGLGVAKLKYKKPHIPPFRQIARVIIETANEVLDEEAEAFAEEETELFKDEIRRQTFSAFRRFPLSLGYLRRKQLANADERVMIATGWYLQNIRVWRHRDPAARPRARWFRVGFHPQIRARNLKGQRMPIHLNRVAWVQEKGSAKMNIPSRPHWKPHYDQMRTRAPAVRTRIRNRIVREANLKLRGVF